MKAKYLFALVVAAGALLLPRAARAQSCEGGTTCETVAVYDPTSNTISGYSYYENGGCSAVYVESYIWDPNWNETSVGSAEGYPSAEADFSYTPEVGGTFTIAGYNWYELEDWSWISDGSSSYSLGVPSPSQAQITSCQAPSWAIGWT
jgi:hypothetical protein